MQHTRTQARPGRPASAETQGHGRELGRGEEGWVRASGGDGWNERMLDCSIDGWSLLRRCVVVFARLARSLVGLARWTSQYRRSYRYSLLCGGLPNGSNGR